MKVEIKLEKSRRRKEARRNKGLIHMKNHEFSIKNNILKILMTGILLFSLINFRKNIFDYWFKYWYF